MLSRRNFLKLTGLGAAAVGAGFGIGKISEERKADFFRVQAYLPDEASAAELTRIISSRINYPSEYQLKGSAEFKKLISNIYSEKTTFGDGKVIFRIEDLAQRFNGDILISDNTRFIYNPEQDFNVALNDFRNSIKDRKSSYVYSAEFSKKNIFSSLFHSGDKIAVIEDENGIFDKISLNDSYNEIKVKGPSGNTSIRISEGGVNINSSCCRNGICSLSGKIYNSGELIACAPNKIMVRIEEV